MGFAASSPSSTIKSDLDFSLAHAVPAVKTNSFTGKGAVNGGESHTVGTSPDFLQNIFGITPGAPSLSLTASTQSPANGVKNVQTAAPS